MRVAPSSKRPLHRTKLLAAAALAACSAASAQAATIDFGARTWATGGGQGYTAGAYGATATGQWAQDAVLSTPLTLNDGDVISYDSALRSGGWFSNTGFGFIDNTGLYDTAHDAY